MANQQVVPRDKNYRHFEDLEQNVETHTDGKAHRCTECEMSFARANYLKTQAGSYW